MYVLVAVLEHLQALKNQKKSMFNGRIWSIMTGEKELKGILNFTSATNSSCEWENLEGEREMRGVTQQLKVHNSGINSD